MEWGRRSEPEEEEILVSWEREATGLDWQELEENSRSGLSLTETAVSASHWGNEWMVYSKGQIPHGKIPEGSLQTLCVW